MHMHLVCEEGIRISIHNVTLLHKCTIKWGGMCISLYLESYIVTQYVTIIRISLCLPSPRLTQWVSMTSTSATQLIFLIPRNIRHIGCKYSGTKCLSITIRLSKADLQFPAYMPCNVVSSMCHLNTCCSGHNIFPYFMSNLINFIIHESLHWFLNFHVLSEYSAWQRGVGVFYVWAQQCGVFYGVFYVWAAQ